YPYLHSFPTRRSSDFIVIRGRIDVDLVEKRRVVGAAADLLPEVAHLVIDQGGQASVAIRHPVLGDERLVVDGIILVMGAADLGRSEEHTSELQSLAYL